MTPADNTPVQADAPKFLLMKRGLYYRADNQGYTGKKSDAGRYHKSEASPDHCIEAIHEDEAGEYAPACWMETKLADKDARIAELEARLAHKPTTDAEPFAYYVEHTGAEPGFIRPPCYVPSGPNYRVTPVYVAHPPADKARIAESKPKRLPKLSKELYENYPSMSAQTHEAEVKAYARAALENRNG